MTSTEVSSSTYVPATIPADLHGSTVAILWAAANIVATTPKSADALTDAIAAQVADRSLHQERRDIPELLACDLASRRHLLILDVNVPSTRWGIWQSHLDNPWQILADAAESWVDDTDRRIGLTPGHWTTDPTHQANGATDA